MNSLNYLIKEIKSKADPEKAKLLARYFKTEKGDYGEGDVFLGIVVPESRKIAKKYENISLENCQILLNSKIHEERFISLLILMLKYKKTDDKGKEAIFNFYLSNSKKINNWDLVDVTCRDIIGAYLFDKPKDPLYKLAKSSNIWEKRISIISTFYFISKNKFEDTLKIAEILLHDKHDLIHKAVGWALREVGNRNRELEKEFLKKYHKKMPRTMLRYAIEKFPEAKRKAYLKRP